MTKTAQVIDFPKAQSNCTHCAAVFDCPFASTGDATAANASPARNTARMVRRDDHLFRVGDPASGLHVVRSGAIKTYVVTASGDEQVIGLYGPGELIDVDALADGTQTCNAIALDVSTVCAVSIDQMTEACAKSANFCRGLLASLGNRIRHDEAQFVVLGHKNADQRVASFLVEQVDACLRRRQPSDEILLPMPRADIASYLAMAVETVSRVLTRLQEAGVLHVNRNLISIVDESALRATAGISEPQVAPARARTH